MVASGILFLEIQFFFPPCNNTQHLNSVKRREHVRGYNNRCYISKYTVSKSTHNHTGYIIRNKQCLHHKQNPFTQIWKFGTVKKKQWLVFPLKNNKIFLGTNILLLQNNIRKGKNDLVYFLMYAHFFDFYLMRLRTKRVFRSSMCAKEFWSFKWLPSIIYPLDHTILYNIRLECGFILLHNFLAISILMKSYRTLK